MKISNLKALATSTNVTIYIQVLILYKSIIAESPCQIRPLIVTRVMKIQCQQYGSQNRSERLKVRESLQRKSIRQNSRFAYPYPMFLYKFFAESPTQGSIAVCTQPSCVGLNQASQLFSWIASSVDNWLPIWVHHEIWFGRQSEGLEKYATFKCPLAPQKQGFDFWKGPMSCSWLLIGWGKSFSLWRMNCQQFGVLSESAIHTELI